MADVILEGSLQKLALKRAAAYLNESPEEAFPKLLKWLDQIEGDETIEKAKRVLRDIASNPEGHWYKFIKNLWADIDDKVRLRFFENFIINATVIGRKRQRKYREQYKCNIPWAILLDPTSACNIKCIGCWAAEYGQQLNLSYETMDKIIRQGKELDTYMYIYSGGEPLIRKKDIIKLCKAHSDCQFMAFTNGTLIDDEFAGEMLQVKNFIPSISQEGFEAETDARRGKGTYQAGIKAMEILQRHKLPFGVSCCYTRNNVSVVGKEAYFDDLIKRGAKFAWFFTYMPIGAGAPLELMVTAEQRAFMYRQIRKFRSSKPLFTIDFWNDGEYVEGCIAGGRCYIHINADGDIEPCAFIHYSDSNIREKTLLQAYQSPLFMQYYDRQPFNENHLRPCPLLDNAGVLARMVHEAKAQSTEIRAKQDVDSLCASCKEAAKQWEPVANALWQEDERKKQQER